MKMIYNSRSLRLKLSFLNIVFLVYLANLALSEEIKLNHGDELNPQEHTNHQKHGNGHHHGHVNSGINGHRPRHGKLKKQILSSGSNSVNYNTAGSNNEHQANVNNLQRDYLATTVGKDVQIDCKMKNLSNEDDKIVWLKMPKGEVLALNGNRVTQDPRISTRCVENSSPCWSLIITNTRESDTGFYVCQTNAMQTKYVYLDIMVPPKLLTQYPVDRIDVNQTMNASITCEFYGKPEPLIKWYKYHNSIPKEIEKYRGFKTINLYIHKDSPSEFECVADNSIPPTVSKKIFLNIQYSPQIKFLNSKVFQKKNERVIFDCIVSSNPRAKIYWYKNQTKIVESRKYNFETIEETNHRLYINTLNEGDFTDYYCTAVNLLGKATSKIELIELRSTVDQSSRLKSTKILTSNNPATTTVTKTSPTTITTATMTTSTAMSQNNMGKFSINNNLFYKSNETEIKVSLKDEFIVPEDDGKYTYPLTKTTHKNRVHKLPNYRSNKLNHNQTKHIKNHKKQQQYNSNLYYQTPMSIQSSTSTKLNDWLADFNGSTSIIRQNIFAVFIINSIPFILILIL